MVKKFFIYNVNALCVVDFLLVGIKNQNL